MKKFGLLIALLVMTASSANAGYWSHTPSFGGGWKSTYVPSYGYQGNNQWGWR